jgi:hypothetical protein
VDWTERLAAIRNEEQRVAAHRLKLQATNPLNADDIRIVLHTWRNDVRDCRRCGGPYDDNAIQVHLVMGQETPSIKTAVCSVCVTLTGEHGAALVALREAMEELDSAFSLAPDDRLRSLMILARNCMDLQFEAYRAAEQERFVGLYAVPDGGDL